MDFGRLLTLLCDNKSFDIMLRRKSGLRFTKELNYDFRTN